MKRRFFEESYFLKKFFSFEQENNREPDFLKKQNFFLVALLKETEQPRFLGFLFNKRSVAFRSFLKVNKIRLI